MLLVYDIPTMIQHEQIHEEIMLVFKLCKTPISCIIRIGHFHNGFNCVSIISRHILLVYIV